jgi:hypothetical protein
MTFSLPKPLVFVGVRWKDSRSVLGAGTRTRIVIEATYTHTHDRIYYVVSNYVGKQLGWCPIANPPYVPYSKFSDVEEWLEEYVELTERQRRSLASFKSEVAMAMLSRSGEGGS